MSKKQGPNKVGAQPKATPLMPADENNLVLIEILPLCGIGGIGRAGDRGWVTQADADQYVADKQAKVVKQ